MNRKAWGAALRLVLAVALLTLGPAQGVFAADTSAPAEGAQLDRIAQFNESAQRSIITQEQREAALRQSADGRLANFGEPDNVTDMAANGEPVLRAAAHLGDAGLRAASGRMLEYLLKQRQAGKLRFLGISGHAAPPRFLRLLEHPPGVVRVRTAHVVFERAAAQRRGGRHGEESDGCLRALG